MKRILIAALLAGFAVAAAAATQPSDEYRNNAGEQDQHQPQVGDASGYRFDAGEEDRHQPQVADAGSYRGTAGEKDQAQPQLG
jgi:Spy/CpxP family protein refolding chaperone